MKLPDTARFSGIAIFYSSYRMKQRGRVEADPAVLQVGVELCGGWHSCGVALTLTWELGESG
jgi:hypothetical protein